MLGASKEYDLAGRVIGVAMKVHSALGPGFLESVYQNALIWELQKGGLKTEAGSAISVRYDGQIVGAFTADLLVNDCLMVELKATQSLAKAHEVQLVNYLVATGIDEGLLLNFGGRTIGVQEEISAPQNRTRFALIPNGYFC